MERIEHQSLSDKVYTTVKTAIIRGSLTPGQKLVVTDVAEQLGVSRTPVRDAFQRLSEGGLVEITTSGTYVMALSPTDFEELYAVRAALEGLAAERAAERMTADGLKQLRNVLQEMEEAAHRDEVDGVVAAAARFHQVIVDASQNSFLRDILEDLREQLEWFRRANTLVVPRRKAALEEHRSILEALETGDAELARQEMVSHVRHSMESRLAAIHSAEPRENDYDQT